MENKALNLNDFVAFLLKTNEDMQNRVNITNKDQEGLSNLKIQKLIYFIEASFLVKFNSQLFVHNYRAWAYGPVVPELYLILSKFGRNPLFYHDFKKTDLTINFKTIKATLKKDEFAFLKNSFIYFNKYSPFELVALSHIDGPWKGVANNEIISKVKILEFFKEIFKNWAIS